MRPRLETNGETRDGEEMDIDSNFDRRGSSVSTITSPSQPEIVLGNLGPGGGQKPPSPSALINQRFVSSSPFIALLR